MIPRLGRWAGILAALMGALFCGPLHAQVATTTTLIACLTVPMVSNCAVPPKPNPPSAPHFGQRVTLTAIVSPAPTIANPPAVSFTAGGVMLGVSKVNASGVATITTTLLRAGRNSLQAFYPGYPGVDTASSSTPFVYIVEALSGSGFNNTANITVGSPTPSMVSLPFSVAVGDFTALDLTKHGNASLAVANYNSNTVSVLIGNGDGTFQSKVDYPVGTHPISVAVGDIFGDGILSLAVANFGSSITVSGAVIVTDPGSVTILHGNGYGAFYGAQSFAAGSQPRSIAVLDYYLDGIADLAVANYSDQTVSLFYGTGHGAFQAPASTNIYANNPMSLAVGDFNGDGYTDIAVVTLSGAITLLTGGGVEENAPLSPNLGSYSIAGGDFDGDGQTDIVVANASANTVTVFLTRKSSFGDVYLYPTPYIVGTNPYAVAVGDFNGDGKLDIAVANGGSNGISILLGNGNGTFQTAVSGSSGGSTPAALAVGDFNGDGIADLAVANQYSSDVSILLGLAPPATSTTLMTSPNPSVFGKPVTLSAQVTPVPSNGPIPSGKVEFLDGTTVVGIGTLDGTGNAQLVTSGLAAGVRPLRALYELVPGLWQQSESAPVVEQTVNAVAGSGFGTQSSPIVPGADPIFVAVGDFWGSGLADLAVAEGGSPVVWLLRGNGTGTFQYLGYSVVSFLPTSIAVGDFDGNGTADLAVSTQDGVSVLLGNGGGTFQTAKTYGIGYFHSVAVGDFNGDGKADLVVANDLISGVSVFLGNGDGTFQAPLNFLAGNGLWSVAVGYFNADSIADLVVTNEDDDTISVLLGNGDGTFQPAVNYRVGNIPISVVVGNFRGQGVADLAVANNGDGTVSILLGNGDGTFKVQAVPCPALGAFGLAVGDFNGDGKADLAVSRSGSAGNVGILRGNGDGTFQTEVLYGATSHSDPFALAVGEFNGDGIADLAVADISGSITLMLGTQAQVPNVVGQTQAAATTAITGAGLSVGMVTMASSGTVAAGSVISQSPAAGTGVTSALSVNLVISTGPSTLQSIAVTPANPSIAKGLTQQFTATGTYSDSSTQNLTPSVMWASGTATVATIAAGGLATAAGVGTSNITASLNGVTSPVDVLTVPAPTLQSIAVTPANPSMVVGTAQQFAATGTYSDGSTQNLTGQVTWASATTAAVTITAAGKAAGVKVGASAISATLGLVSGSTTLTITPLGACDVAQQGSYTVADAQAITNAALGEAPATNDLNGDGKVNVVDVQIIINSVLKLGCTV